MLLIYDNPINSFCNHVTNPQVTISRLQDLPQKFSNVFNTKLGCCTKTKISLHLKNDARFVFRPKGYLFKICLVYLDDVIIFGKSFKKCCLT